jgi:excisionase family DNA binding protein
MTNDILTIKELADYLKLNEKTTYRLASKGDIPGFKIGGSWRFERTEIEKWIERQSEKQAGLGSKSA